MLLFIACPVTVYPLPLLGYFFIALTDIILNIPLFYLLIVGLFHQDISSMMAGNLSSSAQYS